jgi:hypothetical protein
MAGMKENKKKERRPRQTIRTGLDRTAGTDGWMDGWMDGRMDKSWTPCHAMASYLANKRSIVGKRDDLGLAREGIRGYE